MLSWLVAILWLLLKPIAILSLLYYINFVIKLKYKQKVTANIKGPPCYPIIGNGHIFIGNPPYRNFQIFQDLAARYGYTYKLWLGPQLCLVLADVEDAERIMSNVRFNDKSDHYSHLRPWLQEGLLVSGGRKWHQRRKVLTPAFHFKTLNKFIEVFEKQSRIFVENLDKEYKQQTEKGFDLYHWLNLCTLDVLCETAMGVSVNAQTNAESDYVKAIKTIVEVLHKRMFNILYRYDLTYRCTALARREKQALAIIHGFSESVIIQRRAELLKSTPTESKQANESPLDCCESKKRMAFLDILLQSEIDGKPLSNLDIREEVDTFMFEGHDTTSSALNFCFYNLALNPECQQKCMLEILEILGEDLFKPIDIESLNKLQYLELCIKETLRLFPSVPLFGRQITHEFELNGKTIPAGANVGISPFLMGRRADLYPDPLRFNPDRFRLGYDATKLNPYAYIPFAAGPRNCIGQKFAMLEMKVTLANALRRYEFEWLGNREEELKLIAELILRPNEPLMFKIKPRV